MFLLRVIIVIAASLVQISPWFEVGGIKPNLILVVAVSLVVFEQELWKKITVVLVAAIILKAGPTFEITTIIFVLGVLTSILLSDYFRFEREAAIGGAVLITMLALNLTNGFSFIITERTVVLIELVYTTAIGFVIVPLSKLLYEKGKSSKS